MLFVIICTYVYVHVLYNYTECLNALISYVTAGSANAFHKVYEEPIVVSRQPTATAEEKIMGEARANQVRSYIHTYIQYILCVCTYVCVVLHNFM